MKRLVAILGLLSVSAGVPANAGWVFEYNINHSGAGTTQGFVDATSGVGHSRAGVALGEDSFAFCNSGRPTTANGSYNALIYHNCTGEVDNPVITSNVWVHPTDAWDAVPLSFSWGVAYDAAARALLQSNMDPEYSILTWDPDTGASLPWRNELTAAPGESSKYFPSQIILDATGDVFVANYGRSWVSDVSPAVGNIVWYRGISADPDWATGTASPHNPAPLGVYSTIVGATDRSAWDGDAWIMEGLAVTPDGSVLAYTCRNGAGRQGVYVAVGNPVAGYVYAASNASTLLPWYASVTGDLEIDNVRGLSIAPDGQHIFFCIDDSVPNDLIGVWNWVSGVYADPIFLSGAAAVHNRPLDAEITDLPYDVDVYENDGAPSGFALNVLVSPYSQWRQAAKYTGNITTGVSGWSFY